VELPVPLEFLTPGGLFPYAVCSTVLHDGSHIFDDFLRIGEGMESLTCIRLARVLEVFEKVRRLSLGHGVVIDRHGDAHIHETALVVFGPLAEVLVVARGKHSVGVVVLAFHVLFYVFEHKLVLHKSDEGCRPLLAVQTFIVTEPVRPLDGVVDDGIELFVEYEVTDNPVCPLESSDAVALVLGVNIERPGLDGVLHPPAKVVNVSLSGVLFRGDAHLVFVLVISRASRSFRPGRTRFSDKLNFAHILTIT